MRFSLQQSDALEKVSRGFREYSESQGQIALIVGVVVAFGLTAAILYAIAFTAVPTGGLPWVEVDFADDLARARTLFGD